MDHENNQMRLIYYFDLWTTATNISPIRSLHLNHYLLLQIHPIVPIFIKTIIKKDMNKMDIIIEAIILVMIRSMAIAKIQLELTYWMFDLFIFIINRFIYLF